MWPAEWVVEKYAKTAGLGKDFDRETLLKCWQVSPNYASVSLHQMRNLLLIDRVSRARYSLVPPEKWLNLSMFSAQHPEISGALYALLKDHMNQTESLVFYGSRARGVGDELSDWDFLIITSTRARDQMLARLALIREKNPLFTPEIFDLEGLKTCLKKALVFLKVVDREGKIIFDSGLMGLVKTSQVKPINIAHELLGAKRNILMGIALLKNGKPALAAYRVVRGVRLVLLADLAMKGAFSGEDIEREFMHKFAEFAELRKAYRIVKAGKEVEVNVRKLSKLIDNAILTWEEIRKKAGEMVGKEK